MIFGSKDRLAIESEFVENYGRFTYGHLRFWMNGMPFGDWDDASCLAMSGRAGRIFLAHSQERTLPRVESLRSDELYEEMYGKHVQDVRHPINRPYAGLWIRNPFLMDDIGESSLRDNVAVIAVRMSDGRDRILAHDFETKKNTEVILEEGELDSLVRAHCEWAESLWGR